MVAHRVRVEVAGGERTLEAERSHPVDAPSEVVGGFRIDRHWRHTHGGLAARLDTRTTIDVADPVGHWREVDPRRPYDAWRSMGKAVGLVSWAAALAIGWWAGARRGAGPLGVLHRQ